MTFKTRSHTYSLDLAPTDRARCRACKRVISRGSARLVIHASVRPNRATKRMMHAGCVGRAMVIDMKRVHGAVENVPVVVGGVAIEEVERLRGLLGSSQ